METQLFLTINYSDGVGIRCRSWFHKADSAICLPICLSVQPHDCTGIIYLDFQSLAPYFSFLSMHAPNYLSLATKLNHSDLLTQKRHHTCRERQTKIWKLCVIKCLEPEQLCRIPGVSSMSLRCRHYKYTERLF